MSARGSTPKTSSLSSMSPPLPVSRVCTLTFILAFLALVGVGLCLVRRSFRCISFSSSRGLSLGSGTSLLLGCDGGDFLIARQRRHLVHRALVDEAGRSMIFLSGFRLLLRE